MASSPIGLRERKRRATERSIETVSVRIALEEGVEAVTVDRVCDEVMVSRSTFFNYFSSREQAIFGKPLNFVSERTQEVLEKYGDSLPVAASALVVDALTGGPNGDELTRQRLQIFVKQPEWTNRISWAATGSRTALADVLTQWLIDHPEHARLAEADRDREVRLSIGISIIVGEEAMHGWQHGTIEHPFDLPAYLAARDDLRQIIGA